MKWQNPPSPLLLPRRDASAIEMNQLKKTRRRKIRPRDAKRQCYTSWLEASHSCSPMNMLQDYKQFIANSLKGHSKDFSITLHPRKAFDEQNPKLILFHFDNF